MNTIRRCFVHVTIVGLAANLPARSLAGQGVPIGAADIAGAVTGPNGPEAGVWLIGETRALPTRCVRLVMTDDQGRYLIPDLPKGTYTVWVRGYGLVDSPSTQATPGKPLNLTAVPAPNPRAAAEYYPAGYWFSLMRVPDKREFAAATSTGADETHSAPAVKSQAEWLRIMKSGGCWSCHQLGSKGTREIPAALGSFPSSVAAWERRLQSGQAGAQMMGTLSQLGAQRALALFADWTDRIAAGEVPAPPPRPQGVERNVVITEWDWADPKAYLHDEVSTDRRHPTLNANGSLYGSLELSADYLPVLDPARNATARVPLTVRDATTTPAAGSQMLQPSPYSGRELIWPDQPVDPAKDKRISAGLYAVAPAPDGSIWGTSLGFPGAIVRLDPGSHPPETALAELYELPLNQSGEPVEGFSPRGGDVDRNGVYWTALASGHLASFDRRKCKGPLNGPKATGQHCPEGWTFYPEPLPQLQGVSTLGSAEASYYTWVDQFGTLGLGANLPIDTGNGSEGLLVLKDGKWIVLRVPYPMGFYTKWMDGRIDDPNAGWKGRGLWATVSTRAPFHMESGKGTTSKVLHFQLRPDPLAR